MKTLISTLLVFAVTASVAGAPQYAMTADLGAVRVVLTDRPCLGDETESRLKAMQMPGAKFKSVNIFRGAPSVLWSRGCWTFDPTGTFAVMSTVDGWIYWVPLSHFNARP